MFFASVSLCLAEVRLTEGKKAGKYILSLEKAFLKQYSHSRLRLEST